MGALDVMGLGFFFLGGGEGRGGGMDFSVFFLAHKTKLQDQHVKRFVFNQDFANQSPNFFFGLVTRRGYSCRNFYFEITKPLFQGQNIKKKTGINTELDKRQEAYKR